jgi:hypothetical protein
VHVGFLKSARNPTKAEAHHDIKIYHKATEWLYVVSKVLKAPLVWPENTYSMDKTVMQTWKPAGVRQGCCRQV